MSTGQYPTSPVAPATYVKPPTKVMVRRFFALIIDAIIISAIIVGVSALTGDFHTSGDTVRLEGVGIWVGALIGLIYYVICEGIFTATVGKGIFGIRVRMADGSPIGILRALVRNIMRIIDELPFLYFIGWLSAMISGPTRRGRLGDLLAGSYVVKA